mmetsp:Transcript_11970/g.12032  ORF Transcript_11970/g.12032 Transcript_11970/m.12032 type:complete len:153 (-) Transcript_11970:108-566(-)|eukprot:CAMPEP_0182425660 /NCGR_PEP_ID=MMETSP1167-20130531/12137_1 /TAXON_ID=2988 /ORGANISM="Mallomonas Sp, Strain CCMP3275" /LENGTH=152 /DNA_ID=CAMNT_0024606563 /DNA_START=246 /DNA_END=704 /DNA_ORIENTATION=+
MFIRSIISLQRRVIPRTPLPRHYVTENAWTLNPGTFGENQSSIIHFDLYESDNQYLVDADIPGVPKDKISLKLVDDNRILVLEAEQQRQHLPEGTSKYYIRERECGKLKRHIRLPPDVDTDFITASYLDGVLAITIPKLENYESDSKTIEID